MERLLIIRGDDLGVTHSVNVGFRKYAQMGLMSAWSIMAPCPWFPEAVELAKEYSNVDLGMHLTLMSEWKGYRWAPILGCKNVPSLVDKNGYFHADSISLIYADPKEDEIEAELRAQVERVLNAGLKLCYIDNGHGFFGHIIPKVNRAFNRIIKDYNLQASNHIFDPSQDIIASAIPTPEAKLLAYNNWLSQEGSNLPYRQLVMHPMEDTLEQRALKLNTEIDIPFLQDIIFHNFADTKALTSQDFIDALIKNETRIIKYSDLDENSRTNQLVLWSPSMTQKLLLMMGTDSKTVENLLPLVTEA